MNENLKEILQKLCSMVGADYDAIDFTKNNWYLKYEWSMGEEKEFEAWLKKYMQDHKEARDSLMRNPSANENVINRFVKQFMFCYGWRLKLEDIEDENTAHSG